MTPSLDDHPPLQGAGEPCRFKSDHDCEVVGAIPAGLGPASGPVARVRAPFKASGRVLREGVQAWMPPA